jgi:hypothetical protein
MLVFLPELSDQKQNHHSSSLHDANCSLVAAPWLRLVRRWLALRTAGLPYVQNPNSHSCLHGSKLKVALTPELSPSAGTL